MKNVIIKEEIQLNGQILFNRTNSMIVGTITEIREKAIKMDYAVEPIFAGSRGNNLVVYSYSCFLPKSVIINDEHGSLTVKKFVERNFKGGHRIKRYYMEGTKKKFI